MEAIFWIIALYLSLSSTYFFIFGISGKYFYKPISPSKSDGGEAGISFRILIPAYREDAVILATIQNVLRQEYASSAFEVVVIADQLQAETCGELRQLAVKVLEVNLAQSTKAASLRYALAVLPDLPTPAWTVVLDADNHLPANFLTQLAAFIQEHPQYGVVQAHRCAKNHNTPLARLDGLSEALNNLIFRQGHMALGFSSALIGSGMAIRSDLYQHYMHEIKAVSGFDKALELALLQDGIKVAYLPTLDVWDEKVQKAQVFDRQRRRWFSAQWHFARKAWAQAGPQLLRGRYDFVNKALQLSLLPRLLHLGLVGLLALVSLSGMLPLGSFWAGLAGANLMIWLLLIPRAYLNAQLLRDVWYLPLAFGLMCWALWRMKSARHTFLHTPHTYTSTSLHQ